MKIYIKNMAFESCKLFVLDALEELDIALVKIELGEIETKTRYWTKIKSS
ncbi:hypothetical protein [Paucihalobacter ruber]|nr:hypothetical protein [Paucihalobacter ruber]